MNLQETIRRILREELLNETDPKKGTGKKPEGSGRRLYTDENPSDTVSVKFRTKEDIIDTLNKDSFKSKPHKRQSQIINLIHQRVRAAYQNAKDPETKKRLKRGLDYIEGKKEQSKQKTIRLQKQEQNEGELTEKCWKGYTQKGMKTMFGKRYPNCVKKTLKEENYSRFFQRRDYCFNKFFDELENNKELIPEVSYQGGYYTFTIISIAFMLRYCEKNKEYTYNPELHDKIKKEYENRLMSIYRKHGFE